MTSSLWNWLLFTLIQRDKVKWVCVILNEDSLRAANRGSKNLYDFNQNITYQTSMKRRIFSVCLFYFFFWDCRSTNLLRLFSGNLPAMLQRLLHIWKSVGFLRKLKRCLCYQSVLETLRYFLLVYIRRFFIRVRSYFIQNIWIVFAMRSVYTLWSFLKSN